MEIVDITTYCTRPQINKICMYVCMYVCCNIVWQRLTLIGTTLIRKKKLSVVDNNADIFYTFRAFFSPGRSLAFKQAILPLMQLRIRIKSELLECREQLWETKARNDQKSNICQLQIVHCIRMKISNRNHSRWPRF